MSNSDHPGPSNISDEEVFYRKLMMDGEGIDNFAKIFFDWCDAKDQTTEEITGGYEELLGALTKIEFHFSKSAEHQHAVAQQIQEYDTKYLEIEAKLVDLKISNAELKDTLAKAEQIKKNNLKYDALAKLIRQLPHRKDSEAGLIKVKESLTALKEEKKQVDSKLERSEKQLAVIMHSATEFKKQFWDEEKEEWEDSESETD